MLPGATPRKGRAGRKRALARRGAGQRREGVSKDETGEGEPP